jgi:23S rRNA pseudouridine1911/1915/1917 synthase
VNAPADILFEDNHCLALAKPAGQFTQGSWAPAGEITLETAARRHLDPADPSSVYLGIVHRLDRPTSGVLVWAKTPKAARRLSSQFRSRTVGKEYWAIVETTGAVPIPEWDPRTEPNAPEAAGGRIWRDWLTGAHATGTARAVGESTRGAREAVTRWRFGAAIALPPGCMWLQLWPETGRTHQLRVQSARRGMPILGDQDYGATLPWIPAPGIALHARSLRLRHPVTGAEMTLVAPLPAHWRAQGIVLPGPEDPQGTGARVPPPRD